MSDVVEKGLRKIGITVSRPILAVICVIFGILLIVFPDLVGLIVGVFLVIQGYTASDRLLLNATPTTVTNLKQGLNQKAFFLNCAPKRKAGYTIIV